MLFVHIYFILTILKLTSIFVSLIVRYKEEELPQQIESRFRKEKDCLPG